MLQMQDGKVCSKCGEWKSFIEFHKRKDSPIGIRSSCKVCWKQSTKNWRDNNSERSREITRNSMAKWRMNNREKDALSSKEWRKNNKEKMLMQTAIKRARKKKATVSWANKGCILNMYIQRKWLSDNLGIEYHVDHYYPLSNKKVCGLHVETNLRIIPAFENISKNNRLLQE